MIPTAETFLNKYRFKAGEYIGNSDFDTMALYAKEFAKLHVEAALKASKLETDKFVDENEEECYKPQIFNAYPLENIK
jgi:hypothetical protein